MVISFFGVTAHARQQCQDIKIYTSSGCGSVGSVCVSGQEITQKVCYEVPDGAGPIPGSPGPGQSGPGAPGGGGLEEQARKETEAKKKEQQEKYCKSQPAEIGLKQQTCIYDAISFTNGQANQCSNFTWGLSWIAGFNYNPSCRSYWAGEQAAHPQRCNVVAAEAVAALAKVCP